MSSPPEQGARRGKLTIALLSLSILAAVAVPRIIALGGQEGTHHLVFMDMMYHQANQNALTLAAAATDQRPLHPFLLENDWTLDLFHGARWSKAIYRLNMLWHSLLDVGLQSPAPVLLTNLLFTLLMVLGVVALGREMGGRRLGLWAGLFTALCPALLAHSWYISLDYPLVALIPWALFLLWRSRGFVRPAPTLAFALVSGLAMYIKLNFALYLLFPSLVALVLGLRAKEARRLRVLGHAAGATLLVAAMSYLLQGWTTQELWQLLAVHWSGPAWNPEDTQFTLVKPWTPRWAATMLLFAAANYPWPLLLLAAPGLVLLHLGRKDTPLPGRWLLLSFIWGTYLILTLLDNKMERYLQPIYPTLALLCAWWVWDRVPRRARTPVLAAMALAHAAVLVVTHLHPTPWYLDAQAADQERYMYELGMPGQERLAGLRRHGYHPSCQVEPLIKKIHALAGPGNSPLAAAIQWPEPGDPLLHSEGGGEPLPELLPVSSHDLFLSLAHLTRDRPVLMVDTENQARLHSSMLDIPALILVHPGAMDLAARYPGLRIGESREHLLRCDRDDVRQVPVMLTRVHMERKEKDKIVDPDLP